MLFGVGYGTGVRIGYEQVYPLLFPAQTTTGRPDPKMTADNLKSINKIYDTIGGKEASQMGIAKGLSSAMSELDTNPDFRDLMELEYGASGRTPSSSNLHNKSLEPTSSQAGFLSDQERASALKQLEINRQKTIEENIAFDKRNKLNAFKPPPPIVQPTFTVKFPPLRQGQAARSTGASSTITIRYKDNDNKQRVIAFKGTFGLHARNIKKWLNAQSLTRSTKEKLLLSRKINAYQKAIASAYPGLEY